MQTIFETIREDHDRQREMLDQLVETQGDSKERADLFGRLKAELQDHAGAEERFFYIPLMEHDLTQEHSRHSVAEHHEIDEAIEKLEETELSSPAWLQHARNLQHLVVHHLEEEEREVFQMAGRALSDEEKVNLAASFRGDRERREEKR